ncbi:hypothetical protein BGX34_007496 [Mortierella sp. NVP85]|nr:hypothetical protein BGX34_007496 [Mortierella sp. NVP85]
MEPNQPSDTEASSRQIENDKVFRKFFYNHSTQGVPGRAIEVEGCDEHQGPLADQATVILEETPSFKMIAEFRDIKAGHYTVQWRLKTLENFCIPNGLFFAADIFYDDETETSRPFGDIFQYNGLTSLGTITAEVNSFGSYIYFVENGRQYHMELAESIIVRPSIGNARLRFSLSGNRSPGGLGYFGLEFIHVEIKPTAVESEIGNDTVIVERWIAPKSTLDHMQRHTPVLMDGEQVPPITRLAWSNGGTFLASLALAQNIAYITVWDMGRVGDHAYPPQDITDLCHHAGKAIKHDGIGELSIGLAVSESGEQVAIYQEPRIEEWTERSSLKSALQFQLLHLHPPTFIVDIPETAGSRENSINENKTPNMLLRDFVGFCAFLTPSVNGDGGNLHAFRSYDRYRGDRSEPPNDALFAACNGERLDLFVKSCEPNWERFRTISLTTLESTLPWRAACKMMMDSISGDVFMWIENEGRCCSIWDLIDGFNISHISNFEDTGSADFTFQGITKMTLSRDGSIVALADGKGGVTTYYTNSGVAIVDRQFPGCTIEHIGFHDSNHQLCVVTRDRDANLNHRLVDPLFLECENIGLNVPITGIDSALFVSLQGNKNNGNGFIFQAHGNMINCYSSNGPKSVVVADTKLATSDRPPGVTCKSSLVRYRLKTIKHEEILMERDGTSCNVLRVEVMEIQRDGTQNTVFSFVPEPWVRVKTSTAASQASLLSAYFLPCRTRFAIVGQQSIQIWNLPTPDNPKFSLQLIWSDPDSKDVTHLKHTNEFGTVRELYRNMMAASIYVDLDTGGTIAEIEMKGRSGKENVQFPGVDSTNGHLAVISCFRSVHLLAAAFAFSHSRSGKADEISQWKANFKEHAEAIIEFTLKYINHKVFLKESDANVSVLALHWENASLSHSSSSSDTLTIWRLLLDHRSLQDANHYFVEHLLRCANSRWIPDGDPVLNPVKYVIRARNKDLLDVFVEYCTSNAKQHHHAFMDPVVQCLDGIIKYYPSKMEDILRRLSYIPVSGQTYASSHATRQAMGGFLARATQKISNNDIHDNPVVIFRLQLTAYSTKESEESEDDPVPSKNCPSKIYMSPFLFQPWLQLHRSIFSQIVMEDILDSPVIAVNLEYRWFTTSLMIWAWGFLYSLYFCLLALVALTPMNGQPLVRVNLDTLRDPFSTTVRSIVAVATVMGLARLLFDLVNVWYAPWKRLRSPYYLVKITAFMLPVIGCIMFLTAEADNLYNTHRIWITSFGILFLFLNILFEMRVIGIIGVAVNIIVRITSKVFWFICAFIFVLFGFSAALNYGLNGYRYGQCQNDDNCDLQKKSFIFSFSTFFFMAGRYDPISNYFEDGPAGFYVMIALFFMVIGILLLNIMIALMNDAFVETEKERMVGYMRILCDIAADMEYHPLTRREVPNPPKYIYYYATDEEVMLFQSKYPASNVSSLTTQSPVQEMSELGDVKQELAELRGLVKDLVSELKAARTPQQ